MNIVSRRTEYTLNNNEIEKYRIQNNQKLEIDYKNEFRRRFNQEITDEQASKMLVNDLYYNIGMMDYNTYSEFKKGLSNQEKVRTYLKKRADYSAKLQVLIHDMESKGYDVNTILDPKISETYEYKSKNKILLYHGSCEKMELSQIGEPDEDGFYHIRDGISYWTTDYDTAQRYTRPSGKEQKERELAEGNVYSKEIEDGALCVKMADTHGGAFAMWQNELIKLNQMGVRYVFPTNANGNRSDVLDIKNFTDFVQKRDESLLTLVNSYGFRFPTEKESLKNYLMFIKSAQKLDINGERPSDTISI